MCACRRRSDAHWAVRSARRESMFTRNLTVDGKMDQFRFFFFFLLRRTSFRINADIECGVVYGNGEPLANYDSVREAVRMCAQRTSLGATQITVSTVGLAGHAGNFFRIPFGRLCVSRCRFPVPIR